MRLLRSTAAGFLLAAPVFAQWLDYPTARVPRTASGAPDLTAPTPKLADGKPDFSGLWGTMCVNKTILCMPDQAVPPEFGNSAVQGAVGQRRTAAVERGSVRELRHLQGHAPGQLEPAEER